MTGETYPSGRTITTGYDTAGRISAVNGQKTGEANKTYTSQIAYSPHGAITGMTLGNGLREQTFLNNRLQPLLIKLSTSTNQSVEEMHYYYGGTDNNGNVLHHTTVVDGVIRLQVYEYDQLNRLKKGSEVNQTIGALHWQQVFVYDRYGNRNFDVAQTTPAMLGSNLAVDQTTNRYAANQGSILYDAAGNVTRDFDGHTYAYDAENKQTSYDNGAASYSYDGDGRRVKKVAGNAATIFVYDAAGQLVAEYSTSTPGGSGGTSYLTGDSLGTPRVITDANGNVKARHDYLPFGEELYAGTGGRTTAQGYIGNADGNRKRWAQLERDDETGLDYAQARYYSNTQGRFTSVDPLMASGRTGDPQTWNRYIYAYNNPLSFTDPTGLIGDFYNQGGKRLGTDGINDGKVYVVTDDSEAKRIQQADKNKGTTQVSTVSSAVELPSANIRGAIGAAVDRSNSPTADDKKGGFHEEGLIAGPALAGGQETVVNAAPGAYSDPRVDTKATIDVSNPANPAQAGILADITVSAHVHPSGVLSSTSGPSSGGGTTVFGGTVTTSRTDFNQPPSAVDIQHAGSLGSGVTNIVAGARSKTVYIYNGSGVRATFPLKQFLSIGRK